jgi:NitT/TauT family transport system permease protein
MSRLYRFSRWERFTRLEFPSAVIGLVWNAMMSFGGGWFFLAASEAISVLNRSYTLPGLGSYVAAAVGAKDTRALIWAIGTTIVLIVSIDQFFWRPLVTIADRYRLDSNVGEPSRFWVNELWKAARWPWYIKGLFQPLSDSVDSFLTRATKFQPPGVSARTQPQHRFLFNGLLVAVTALLAAGTVRFVMQEVSPREMVHAALLGLATTGRVMFLIVTSTIIWAPIGVAIGFTPKLARFSQPIVQVLASFPANFVFPLATVLFLRFGISLNWGSIFLMALGAQWYLLFNIIGGAQSIPNDLREMAASFGIRDVRLWKLLVGPGIFSSWVTGAITASGGAWNASIVSELVSWGHTNLVAAGLGAYIAEATAKGDWPRIVLGVGMMSTFVVLFNRLLWRRLYRLAETRYRIA